jgi:predicted TIM-barrel fold metal-dependent hydrolase
MRTDVHQHLLPEPLVAALSRRTSPPYVTGTGADLTLHLRTEGPSAIAADDPAARAALLTTDGVERGVVALSAALGIESLPADVADELLEVYAATARELPGAFAAWGAIPLADPDPRRVDRLLDEGFVGLCLPTTALGEPAAVDRLGPVLEALERRGAPLFVHPGPPPRAASGAADWWAGSTDYVAGLHAAWVAWIARGRYQHPTLRVLFAALAGLAPLHAERLVSRGAPHTGPDAYLFYDTSSYGPRAIAAMREAVGPGQLVYGSDRPVVEPTPPDDQALTVDNPARLLFP